MEFGKHIAKGFWGFADKSLPAIYGVGLILLVIRILPEQEYGSFVVIQTLFFLGIGFAHSLAFQPLIKFLSEGKNAGAYIVASSTIYILYVTIISIVFFVFKQSIVSFFDSIGESNLHELWIYLPVMLVASFFRVLAISVLQSQYRIVRIFIIDSIYFLGNLLLIILAHLTDIMLTASLLLLFSSITILASSIASLAIVWSFLPFSYSLTKESLQNTWDLGKYTLGGTSIFNIFAQMDVFFVSSFLGVTALATYSAAKMFTRIYDMLAQVIQMFLIPLSAKYYSTNSVEDLKTVAEKTIGFSSLLVVPLVIIFIFFPGLVLELFYGEKYHDATTILQVLGLMGVFVPWSSVVSSYLIGIDKAKQGMLFGLLLLSFAVVSFLILIPLIDLVGAAAGLVISYMFFTFFLFRYFQKHIPVTFGGVLGRTRDVYRFILKNLRFPPFIFH